MTTEHLDPYVDKAAALVTLLAERADTARQLGRLTDDVVDELGAAGLITLVSPRGRGGAQVSLETFVRVLEELARGCGSTSWVCGVYGAALYMLSSFPDEAQDEVFSDPAPKSVAAFQPEGAAIRSDGGYRLSGTWRFCSGQHHAGWALLSSIALADGAPPVPAQFLVPRADWVAADDWQVSGLSGTGSCSLTVDDAFVPEHRVLPLADPTQVSSLSKALADDPYFGMPFIPFFVTGATGTPLGLACAAVEQFLERVQRRGITYSNYTRQAEAPITHMQMDTAWMKMDQARFHAERSIRTIGMVAADPGDTTLRVRCRADAAWATKLCREVVDIVRQGSGASAIRHQDPLSRIVSDIEALSVHSFLLHSTNSELHGRVLCGLAPDVPFI
jgi:alkylation response protein AidB-like acyl-CoA dehydrogenase